MKMKILGVDFAPLHIPLERRLQTLAAASWFVVMAFGGFIGFILLLCLLFTRLWWLALLYLCWIYIDRDTCEKGARPLLWVKKLGWWYHLKAYFPARCEFVADFKLDPERNYLFCGFPHGIIPAGPFCSIANYYGEFREKHPEFEVKVVILTQQCHMPFTKELANSMGCIASSAKSLNYVLSDPRRGQIVVLMPGGAVEAYNSRPGRYKFKVRNRKGFVKLALKNGSPLVPLISFGDSDLFDQIEGPRLRRVQEYVRQFIGLAPVLFSGRGFFQYSFGMVPRRTPVTTIVGAPIDVTKVEKPTNEEVDALHRTFLEELEKLFTEHKHRYLENAESVQLELE